MNNQTSYLEIIVGPMFSGKTISLNWKLNDFYDKGFSVIKIVNSLDKTRSSENNSDYNHSSGIFKLNKEIKIVYVSSLKEIDIDQYEIIAVDEAQFFPDLKETVEIWLEKGKHVYLFGLDGDYKREPFIELLSLIPLANKVKKLNAFCDTCKREGYKYSKAPFTMRKDLNNKERIVIGGKDIYEACCRKHYKKCFI